MPRRDARRHLHLTVDWVGMDGYRVFGVFGASRPRKNKQAKDVAVACAWSAALAGDDVCSGVIARRKVVW
jgi:hypothetical protein